MKRYIALLLLTASATVGATACPMDSAKCCRDTMKCCGDTAVCGQHGAEAARKYRATPFPNGEAMEAYTPSTLIVYYDGKKGKRRLKRAVRRLKATVIYDYSIIPALAVKIPKGKDINACRAYLKKVKGVLSVERDRVYHLDVQ